MLTVITHDNQKISAHPGAIANCPLCKTPLKPKCGAINIWHFAHVTTKNCDPWYESESDWHRLWKFFLNDRNKEGVVTVDGKKHIADITTGLGTVIEIQYSHLSYPDRVERERFYKNMIWVVFDKIDKLDFTIRPEYESPYQDDFEYIPYVAFGWRYPLRWVTTNMRFPTFIDFGDGHKLLKIEKIKKTRPCWGFGKLISKNDFFKTYLEYAIKDQYKDLLYDTGLFNE